ncbi:MAG: 6-carboxytetrahydropterin synthase QueD [Desulfobacterales bacterium]|jgi:6-pyruvoyltetrahydropterin/6-carboxytetrahydropterin synthase|nr:6-carboxytetrahydropterin synthase QueD [Desulfobacterales bacterium]NOQ65769.1 6-carboxytetrahydropterin synthase QueD [Desulfobacterales bacterium]
MFHIFIKSHFSAGHHLRDYPGNCERPHGHNWKVEVTVKADSLDNLGMGIDFKILKAEVNKVLDTLDHHDLNGLASFQSVNPSSENIAVYIFNTLQNDLSTDRYGVHSVTVRETDNSGVTYFGG